MSHDNRRAALALDGPGDGLRFTKPYSVLEGYIHIGYHKAKLTDDLHLRSIGGCRNLPVKDSTLRGKCIELLGDLYGIHYVKGSKSLKQGTGHLIDVIFRDTYKLFVYHKARRGTGYSYTVTETDIQLTHKRNERLAFWIELPDLYHHLMKQFMTYYMNVHSQIVPLKGHDHYSSCLCSTCAKRSLTYETIALIVKKAIRTNPRQYSTNDHAIIPCGIPTCTCRWMGRVIFRDIFED